MFEQFRSHFPRGSLISELVQIDHGKYIVRASVQNEGLTLATGLAAADTVEEAEDQARRRALAVLDIPLTAGKKDSPQPKVTSSVSVQELSAQSPQKTTPQSTVPTTPRQEKTVSVETTNASSSNSNHVSQASHSATVESETAASASSQQTIAEEKPEKPAPSSTSSVSSDKETMTDSSDIIARTNVELRRLGWTSEQGRKFLQETYGKRSRSLLSDSELLEFLEYLEQQPTPPSE